MQRLATYLLLVCAATAALAAPEASLSLTSPAFKSGGDIPTQFSCKGTNVSPPLQFGNVPANTKSLALSVTDPDAPGGTFTHWLVWNIDPKTTAIGQKELAVGAVEGTNDFGKRGYGGPCPPAGTHRYYFRVFALDSNVQLGAGAKAAAFEKAIAGHVIARGELMARFSH